MFYPPNNIFWIMADALQVLVILILIEVAVSWLVMAGSVSGYTPWVRTLRKVTTPILGPFRAILSPYKTGGLDLSPVIAIILIEVLKSILFRMGVG